MLIIETPIFTKQLLSALSDDEYRLFQTALLERPHVGKVIPAVAASVNCDEQQKGVVNAVA